jgi:hypothetical protein
LPLYEGYDEHKLFKELKEITIYILYPLGC